MLVAREEIVKLREDGLTLREIGERFGISTERVRQILHARNNKKVRSSAIESPLSTGEVARLLNIHCNTVRRWSQIGLLKTYRVGPRGDRRFKKIDVQKLLEKST